MNDFLVDKDGDLRIVNGDFVIGDATLQHQEHILLAHKGEFKESPEIGVGVSDYLLDENFKKALSEIRKNFEYDGMIINELSIDNKGNLNIDANYK